MIVSDLGQAKVFLINIAFGMMCIVLFDLFSVIAEKCGKSKIKLYAVEVLFFVCVFLIFLYAQVRYNLGALRYYQIMGLIMGMMIYGFLFSKITKRLFELCADIMLKLFFIAARLVLLPVFTILKYLFAFCEYLEDKTIFYGEKIKRRSEKVRTKRKNKKKTAKKRLKMI